MSLRTVLIVGLIGIIAIGIFGMFVLKFFCDEFNPDRLHYSKPKIYCEDLNLIKKIEKLFHIDINKFLYE